MTETSKPGGSGKKRKFHDYGFQHGKDKNSFKSGKKNIINTRKENILSKEKKNRNMAKVKCFNCGKNVILLVTAPSLKRFKSHRPCSEGQRYLREISTDFT